MGYQRRVHGGVSSLNPSPTDSVSLYMNLATVAALPVKVSRHNTNSRAHFITKVVRSCSSGGAETIVLVCNRQDMYASGCAVARAYSQYSRKTQGEGFNATPRPVWRPLLPFSVLPRVPLSR